MLSDGDFSTTVTNTAGSVPRLFPAQWTVTGAGVSPSELNGVVTDRAVSAMPDSVSGNAMRLASTPASANVYIAQSIISYGQQGDIFTVSGWCSALSVASGLSLFEPRIGVRFRNATNSNYSEWQRAFFSINRSGWHCVSAQITAPFLFNQIQVGVFYGRNDNTALYTHISLYKELYGESYGFDGNGNTLSVKELTSQQSAATYDSFNNP